MASASENNIADRKIAIQQLLERIATMNVRPLWTQMQRVNPPEPNPEAIPYVWKYEQLRPQLIEAGNLIDERQAERRVLMLTNPKKGKPLLLGINTGLVILLKSSSRYSLHYRHYFWWPSTCYAK